MRFWINAGFLEADQLIPIARAAERLGYAGITLPDHLFLPERYESRYPYSADGTITWQPEAPWPDCWVAIGAMAAAHCCVSVPNFLILEWQIYFHKNPMFKEIIIHDGEMVVDGFLPVSDKPGLGVDINVEAMRQYAAPGYPYFE